MRFLLLLITSNVFAAGIEVAEYEKSYEVHQKKTICDITRICLDGLLYYKVDCGPRYALSQRIGLNGKAIACRPIKTTCIDKRVGQTGVINGK